MSGPPLSISILDAPSNLGLQPPAPGKEPGVARLASALRACEILQRLNARDAGNVTPPAYAPDIDLETGIRNAHRIREFSVALSEKVAGLLKSGAFPLVLGGDCSILIGN